ncbi:MAG: sugar O-acetyltransferase [Clostridia bacterium]|nr:sugar O-acetyltransferase [Clostridia bacterium]
MTETEKMLAGKIYDPSDIALLERREWAHAFCRRYNGTDETDIKKRRKILDKLLPNRGEGAYLQGPVFFDYGIYFKTGKNFYANFNLTVLDCCSVTVGDNVFIGPNCSLVTPVHPLRWQDRNVRFKEDGTLFDHEYAKPIEIGSNCWLASNVTVCGGVKIGSGCVIGAGSVVTRDIPENSFAAGNPCKVIRKITEADAIQLKKELY